MYVLAVTTCPDKRVAKKISRLILESKLAACVNILPGVTSMYWWKGKKKEDSEVMLFIKTKESLVKKLGKLIRENHPYELEEFLTLPIGGSKDYLEWVGKETG